MTHEDTKKVALLVSSDQMQAHLVMREGVALDSMSEETIIAMASAHAIRQTDELRAAVEKAVRDYAQHDFSVEDTFRVLVAEGTPAVDGEDERFVLDASLDQAEPEPEQLDDEESQDHRQRSAFLIVEKGQTLGRLHPPTEGQDGIDIRGEVVSALPGQQIGFAIHEKSIDQRDDGTLVARIPGELVLTRASAMISGCLHIKDSVDYSTGHIRFPGSVDVVEGIRDGFEVVVGLELTVSGLVEAAPIEAGRAIRLQTGMAGRGKGTIRCGTDLSAKYLDGCEIHVGRDLLVENDLNECSVVVTGNVRSPKATFIGTELTCLGECELGSLGTTGGNRCVVTLGTTPECDRLMSEAADLLAEIEEQASAIREKMNDLNADPDQSASKSEHLTHLQFELSTYEDKKKPLLAALERASAVATGPAQLTIHETLHQNTEIRMGGVSAVVSQNIQGPVEIKLNDEGEMICRDLGSNTSMLMASLANVTPAEGSYRLRDLPQQLRPAA